MTVMRYVPDKKEQEIIGIIARPVKAKIYGVLYNQSSFIAFDMKHLVIGQLLISRLFIGYHT